MADFPYIVKGRVTDSNSTNPSGVKVVARNDRTIENINTTTDASGDYILDLANLSSGYNIGDQITIIVRDGLEEGDGSFTITSSETVQTKNITTSEILDSSDVAYCTITEVYDELDGKTTTDISANLIRDKILRSEAFIDLKTKTSFKSNTVTDEFYDTSDETMWLSPESKIGFGADYNSRADSGVSGKFDTFHVKNTPVISITSLSKNTGSATGADSFTSLTQQSGSGGDYILNPDKTTITFVDNAPYFGKKRSFKMTYTWGLNRSSTDRNDIAKRECVRELAILLTVKQILGQKGNRSQFDSQDNISLESITITTSVTQLRSYLENITSRINELFGELGVFNVSIGMI